MGTALFFKIASQVVGGLGVFLLGMKFMSEGLQAISGDRLRRMISAVTNNRIMGVVVGLVVTCLVQSSSVTTVMAVGFVNSGIMTLMQAIGVVMGANVGTTITGWILVLKIGKYGLPILGIAAFFFLFSKRDRVRYIGMAIMGVGMVFFGLELMKDGFKPLRAHPEFEAWFLAFEATSYLGIIKCALVGCVLTMLVQSSSATLGITIGLASTGVIQFQTAAALVLGENIGTTVTAWLASLGTTTTAKRAACAHVFFNVLGTIWFIALFPLMIPLISKWVGSVAAGNPLLVDIEAMDEKVFAQVVTAGIASVHTSFNVANVVLFVPFAGVLGKVVSKLVPEKRTKEVSHLTYLDVRMLDTPALGMLQSKRQIMLMAESVGDMMGKLRGCAKDAPDRGDLERDIFEREKVLDNVQKEVFVFLSNVVAGQMPHDATAKAHAQMRLADEYESLGDYVTSVLKALKKLKDGEMALDGSDRENLIGLHDRVEAYISKVGEYVEAEEPDLLLWARSEGLAITKQMKAARRDHQTRLQNEEVSPFLSLIVTDILNYYRRMKDHALNIAEVIAGEK